MEKIIITVIEFVISLGILAFLHELGHFLTARFFRIEVEEFGFGFPPRLVRLFTLGGTDFTLNWIPFGAFVKPKGENDPSIAGGLGAANPFARLVVLLGGPVMNLIAGIFLFSLVFVQTGAPNTRIVQIMDVNHNSPAALSGIQKSDIIIEVNGIKIDSTQKMSVIIHENLGKTVHIRIKRDGRLFDIEATPRVDPPKGEGALGIVMGNPIEKISWFETIPIATELTFQQARQLIMLPALLIQNQITPDQARIVGPKGMFDIYAEARNRDIESTASAQGEIPAVNTLWLMAVISVALGITNLLPIPALDGGRILFLFPEIILRRRLPAEYENMVHLIGFVALIALMFYITTQDIINPIVIP